VEAKQGNQGVKSRKYVKKGSRGNMEKWVRNKEVEEGSQ
jgi:hypothetical protein